MSSSALKVIGIVCSVVCLILLFVAYERYQVNAKTIEDTNQRLGQRTYGPYSGRRMFRQGDIEVVTPTATKYAALLAVLSGLGGLSALIGCCRRNGPQPDAGSSEEATKPNSTRIGVGIGSLILSAIMLFAAFERGHADAPVATMYVSLLAILSGFGGLILLVWGDRQAGRAARIGIVLLALCAVLAFIAYERYQAGVKTMYLYVVLIASLAGLAGLVCLVRQGYRFRRRVTLKGIGLIFLLLCVILVGAFFALKRLWTGGPLPAQCSLWSGILIGVVGAACYVKGDHDEMTSRGVPSDDSRS